MPHGTRLTPEEIPPCFYRISAKALILDDSRTKFLILQEKDGRWELPGGGIEHGEDMTLALRREIKEEMGLDLLDVKKDPSYVTTFLNITGYWLANVLYEAVPESLKFTPSPECVAIRFVTSEEAEKLHAYPGLKKFAEVFDPKRHK